MSEYRYYEFQAIDRPLTDAERQKLRAVSTRARITPTSFVNEYQWGDFKGNIDAWMEKYFDAFIYFANWGSHTLKLRVPTRLLDSAIVRPYCHDNITFFRERNGNVILTFCSENDGGDDSYDPEGPGLLSSLISVRAELARGDLRALYLGWLVAIQSGEADDEEIEPPVPAGLGQPSGSLEALADFLRVDLNLLRVAAQTSKARTELSMQRDEVAAWIAALPLAEKDEILTRLIVESTDSNALPAELLQRFLKARDANRPDTTTSPDPRRTVGALLQAAQARTEEHEQAAARKAAAEKARREREAATARVRHLDRLTGQEPRLWTDIDRLVLTKLPKNYDQAIHHLVDLRDLADRVGPESNADFASRLENFRAANARKPSLLERIARAGL